jgi:hypothetical protein
MAARAHRKRRLVADRAWRRRFDDPIPLPRGRQLVTLEDAGRYIIKFPKAEHERKRMAGRHGSLGRGDDGWWATHVCPHLVS